MLDSKSGVQKRAGGKWSSRRSRLAFGSLFVAVTLAVTGCSSSGSTAASKTSNDIKIVLPEEPTSLDPCDTTISATGEVLRRNVTESLTFPDATTGELQPGLATKWTQVSPTKWSFQLREGVKFQNGEAFNAQAAAASIQRASNADLGCNVTGSLLGNGPIEAQAVGDYTLEITTTAPDPILPRDIAAVDISAPQATSMSTKTSTPVGTGPYKLASTSADSITLTRWDGYWGNTPKVQTATFQWQTEASVREALSQTNGADIVYGLPPQDIGKTGVVQYQTGETLYYRIDTQVPPLNDLRVRKAINLAIDRAGIITSALGGLGTPASQIVPPSTAGYNTDLKPFPFDATEAKTLIDAAKADGVPVDTPITIISRIAQFPGDDAMNAAVQAELQNVGLNVTIQRLQTDAWLKAYNSPFNPDRAPNLVQVSHGNNTGDPAHTITTKYLSTSTQTTLEAGTTIQDMMQKALTETGTARTTDFQAVFAYLYTNVIPDAPVADRAELMYVGPQITYTPNSQTIDEFHLSEVG